MRLTIILLLTSFSVFLFGQNPVEITQKYLQETVAKEIIFVSTEKQRLYHIKDNTIIDPVFLENNGYIKSSMKPVKILGSGKISKKIKISASAFSSSAKDKIEKAGGETILL